MAQIMNSPEIKKLMRMESTSEICDQHPRRVNRPIYKIIVEGEVVCPVCESQKASDELGDLETDKMKVATGNMKYNLFASSSLLTDVGLYDSSFGNYEEKGEEVTNNKRRAEKAYKQYRNGVVFNTLLTGLPGTGKSHLAMSILRNLNESGEKDKSCLFVSVDEMLLRIRDSFNNKESRYTEHYFVDLLPKVDFLVLDDLGAETGGTGTDKQATDFTLRVLYAIANGRQNKSTILTTNLTRPALERMYDPKLVSRLLRNSYVIKFEDSEDHRIKNLEF